ncbi:MAG: polysaccharide pyruvyl transferase family protein [Oscillospiraceae bacterium]|nr:polysaccharide pyruvyl transferase family protein [Oscillospiraceae bacterium]
MKVIITNQHCDNRGDESATIGLIKQIYENFGNDAEITMLRQTQGYTFIPEEYGIKEQDMCRKLFFFAQLCLWCMFKSIGLDTRLFATKRVKEFLKLHEEADIVFSSCGGPYIGDIYINHEILHIIYTLVPELLGKCVVFSAPSMGPFKKRFMNPLRRSILKRAKLIVLRDSVSYGYVREFMKDSHDKIFLAADACFAHKLDGVVKPSERRNTIGFTPLSYKYPNSADPEKDKENYMSSLVKFFDMLMEKDEALSVEFFPQLYNKHSDMPLINDFISRMKYPDRTIVFSDKESGVKQQMEIANMKMMVATRYHSAVFSCKMCVPCLCIAYEHKAFAMMKSFDLEDCTIDINNVSYDLLAEKYDYIQSNCDSIYQRQVSHLPKVTENAQKTVLLGKEFYENGKKQNN